MGIEGRQLSWGYFPQVAQLVAEHVLQESLPPIAVGKPSSTPEKALKEENIRPALLWHVGQEAALFA